MAFWVMEFFHEPPPGNDFRWRCKEKEHSVLFGSNIGIGIGTEFRLREGEIIAGETGKGNA